MSEGDPIHVKARWSRPAWCRDDWCHIRLPNGYRYYSANDVVEFIDDSTCWVRASFCWQTAHSVEVRFTDYSGEGSLDGVSPCQVKELGAVA